MMRIDDDEDKDIRYSYVKEPPRYTSNVLVGNWYQKRYEDQPQSKTAIVPCIGLGEDQTDDKCEQHISTQQEDYISDEILRDVCRDYIEMGTFKHRNYCNARNSSVVFFDAKKYLRNYSTMNTLINYVWPRMLKKKLALAAKEGGDQHHPTTWRPDPLDSYGNNVMKCKTIQQLVCPPIKTYDREFIPKSAERPKSAKMRDMIDRLT